MTSQEYVIFLRSNPSNGKCFFNLDVRSSPPDFKFKVWLAIDNLYVDMLATLC